MVATYQQKGLLGTVTSVAVILAVSSAAFACTTYRARFTVTGTAGTSVTAEGDASGSHKYCTVPIRAAEVGPNRSFTALVTPTTNCAVSSKLTGDYRITYLADSLLSAADCMSTNAPIDLGPIVMDSDGYSLTGGTGTARGSRSYSIPTGPGSVGSGAICVTNSTTFDSNQVPVNVI